MTDRQQVTDRMRKWCLRSALPFWAESGPDRVHGGFIEELEFSGRDAARPFKRTRVTCRQVYVFAHATLLGWDDGRELIHEGAQFLIDKAWTGEGGFVRRLDRAGDVLDPTIDLYDNAFALFAFSWAFRATGDVAYRDWMNRTLDAILRRLAHPGQGLLHQLPAEGWRLQNPHMHLTEACLAAYRATGDEDFRAPAVEIMALVGNRFVDPASGALFESFRDDWSPAPGDAGRVVEPGHMLEWAWILTRGAEMLGTDTIDLANRMTRRAEAIGLAPDGAVRNSVGFDGTPIDGGSRTWPNTERLKAAVALQSQDAPAAIADAMIVSSGELLLDRYLTSAPGVTIPAGTWIDAFTSDGQPAAKAIPASTLYHVFLAFAECFAPDLPAISQRNVARTRGGTGTDWGASKAGKLQPRVVQRWGADHCSCQP